jgi:hypothetical protein
VSNNILCVAFHLLRGGPVVSAPTRHGWCSPVQIGGHLIFLLYLLCEVCGAGLCEIGMQHDGAAHWFCMIQVSFR